jgi:hypothetical protein
MSFRFLRWCGLSVALLAVIPVGGAIGDSRDAKPEPKLAATPRATHPLRGRWRIDYHPNAAVREYTVSEDGLVTFADFPEWKGKLTGSGSAKSGHLLRFEGDSEDRVERLTLVADGRLLVEHYNPATTFAEERRPDQIGLGVAVE